MMPRLMKSTFHQSLFSILRFDIRRLVYSGISLLGVNYDAVIIEEYISSIVILNSAVRYSGIGYLLAVLRNQFLVSTFRR